MHTPWADVEVSDFHQAPDDEGIVDDIKLRHQNSIIWREKKSATLADQKSRLERITMSHTDVKSLR